MVISKLGLLHVVGREPCRRGKIGLYGCGCFFVISDYLIANILSKRLVDGNFSFGDFYLSRIRRLAPPFVVVLLLTIVIGFFYLLPRDFISLFEQVVASQFYLANIYGVGAI